MTPFLAEILGTALLILLGNGTVANVVLGKTKGHDSGWIVISVGWGLAVFVGVFAVAAISGAHINPAVTLGLAVAGKFSWSLVPSYMAAQFIDVHVFHLLKEKTNGKMLWLRNNASTLISQLVDTSAVILITYYYLIKKKLI